jgi:choline-sulfatase
MITRRAFLKSGGVALAASIFRTRMMASVIRFGRPNVLFIMTDQQFAEALSCRMGRQLIHTPAMDSLAANGTVFTCAYTPNPLCMPARNSLFTGRYPHETGVTRTWRSAGPGGFTCLGTISLQAGYETAYYGKWH